MRELRNSVPGWIFCIVFATHLIFCKDFVVWFINQLKILNMLGNNNETVLSILIGIFTVFGAEAVGYIFSNIVFCCFNARRGYHRIWKDSFSPEYLEEFERKLKDMPLPAGAVKSLDTDIDNLFSYYWQKSDNKELVEWVSRRFTTYFLNWSIILAMAIGYTASWYARYVTVNATIPDFILFVIIILISAVLYFNARHTKKDAVNVIIFWLFNNFKVSMSKSG